MGCGWSVGVGTDDGVRILMARTYDHIIGPIEGHAADRVKTPDDYLRVQAAYLKHNRDHSVDVAVPHEATAEELAAASAPFINLGQWCLLCACNNAPSVSFEWDLACCFECGAIYRNLTPPVERARLELVLVERGRRGRNWDQSETLADVIDQNLAEGDAVPDADVLDGVKEPDGL